MKAIHRGPNGEVLVDQAKCIGCRMCIGLPSGRRSSRTRRSRATSGRRNPWRVDVRPRTPAFREGGALHALHAPTAKGELPRASPPAPRRRWSWLITRTDGGAKALIDRAQAINEAAGTHPKIRFVSSHTDFRKLGGQGLTDGPDRTCG